MGKAKYHFNPKSLTYEKVKHTFTDMMLKVVAYVATGLVFSSVVLLIAYNLFNSPKELNLLRENQQYKLELSILNDRLEQLADAVKNIEEKDDNIYRVIFESEPVADEIRNGGYGGAEKYNNLKGFDNSDILIETNLKIDKIARKLSVQNKSFDDVFEMAQNKNKMLASIPAIQPIRNKNLKNLVSGFGMRIHPIYKTLRMHQGVDFVAPTGTPIYATGDGVIMYNDNSLSGYGKVVVINHGYGYKTLYAHMSSLKVKPGQKVKRGEIIGTVGSSGLSTGPHLHYEIRKGNKAINPVNFFFNDLSPAEYQKIIEIASKVNQAMS
ncbi:MAG: peptidase M23 [Bacteroidetes bacterium GWF2_29_10]|nr:MAG: peptidase M23 [Bacteroidetes bacterium GWF2_29_10]